MLNSFVCSHFLVLYSQKISRVPIIKEFKVFCLTSKFCPWIFSQKSTTDKTPIQQLHNFSMSIHACVIASDECLYS